MFKRWLNEKKIAIVCAVITLLFYSSMFIVHVSAAPDTANIAIVPSTLTVGEEEGVPTDPFLVNVTITDVSDMYSWQATIFYNNNTLNCTDVLFPADNVFYGKPNIPVKSIEKDQIMCGSVLMGIVETFTGSGLLCQLNFTGIAEGTSDLEISSSTQETFLLDSAADDILYTVENGEIIVVPEFPAFLIVPLLVIATLAAIIARKTLWSKKQLKPDIVK